MHSRADEIYLTRALHLAEMADLRIRTNPKVGAVLVYDDKIIGEGYHEYFGGPHAEVNCLNSVPVEMRPFIHLSTLYVTLEPCAHFGKTPPCTDLIIDQKIPRVVIGCQDPFPEVNGKGVKKLMANGIQVDLSPDPKPYNQLIAPFVTFHLAHRPYIMLKWAESQDQFMGKSEKQIPISSPESQILVHRWRTQFEAILIGTNTALTDNPQLTNRWSEHPSPLRCIPDRQNRIPRDWNVFSEDALTLIWSETHCYKNGHIEYAPIEEYTPEDYIRDLYSRGISSVMIEGGSAMLKSFIRAGLWDEARILTSETLIGTGVKAPHLNGVLEASQQLGKDHLQILRRLP